MEIIISFTILLIAMLLGRSNFQVIGICLSPSEQIVIPVTINSSLVDYLFTWAVKLKERRFYMLNTITLIFVQKATETIHIQPQNLKFEG